MPRRFSLALSLFCLLIVSGIAAAQDRPLSVIVPRAILQPIQLSPTPDPVTGVIHTAHFDLQNAIYINSLPDQARAVYQSQLELSRELNRQIGSQLSSFPLGSSSGGFAFTLDPSLGTFSRSSDSFGPLFAERAYTVGRNNISFGMNYMRRTYDVYDGRDLRQPEIKFYFPHNDCCPPPTGSGDLLTPFFEGDVLEAALTVNLDTDTVSFFSNYGVTDRFDIGIAVPIVSVDLKTGLQARIQRLATGAPGNQLIHSFDGQGLDHAEFTDAGSATGIGDIALRGKYRFLDQPGGGLAMTADLRLPTGKEEDLRGTGATQFTLTFIGSWAYGRVAPHVNVGYTVAGGISDEAEELFVGNPPNEFDYTGGVDVAITPRLTLAGDLIGRTLFDIRRLVDADLTFTYRTVNAGPDQSTTFAAFATEEKSLNMLLGSTGVKYNVTKTLLLSFNLLFSLTDGGLTDRVTPVIGFDYTFSR
jgi:hypothetical protein